MQGHQIVGIALFAVGAADGVMSFVIPNRIADERGRLRMRIIFLSSGFVLVALGVLFFAGMIGAKG